MTETLELTVPELDCADEARQIQAALGRLGGVAEVRTAVSTRKAVIAYDPRQYGRTGLTYRKVSWVVPSPEQSHRRKEAGHGEGYYTRGAR